MIKFIDTYEKTESLFKNKCFDIEEWKKYINSIYENSSHCFTDEVEEYTKTGEYTFEKDFLPIINNVYKNKKLDELHGSFLKITNGLNEKISDKFGKEVDTDIVLYLGLCNGAGWVTEINNTKTVLLGIEKIIELDWCDIDSMYGLIYHELGHVYHAQYGVLEQNTDDTKKEFVWQLFVEGIAMTFEQTLIGDKNYYHQNTNGWKEWCDENFMRIMLDFNSELPTMTQFGQRYFGDWADYHGHGDTGYYIGARFVHYLLDFYKFDEIISFDIDSVYELYLSYIKIVQE